MKFLKGMDISGNNFCVLKKTWNDSEIILIFHTGAETETTDVRCAGDNAGIFCDCTKIER